nr:DUF5994 family protein [Streptacidiphilus melanogenes]
MPHRVRAGTHTVHLGWFDAEQDPYEISLSSYHVGRWDLLVVPPETDPVTAGRLMAAATEPGNRHSASELVDPAPCAAGGHGAGMRPRPGIGRRNRPRASLRPRSPARRRDTARLCALEAVPRSC